LARRLPPVEAAAHAATLGFHFLWIEMEHSPITLETLRLMVLATRGLPAAVFARVPLVELWTAKRVLDQGVCGVIFPFAGTAEKAARAAAACRYPPSTFIQGSAVGYYGATLDDRPLDESGAPGSDFLAEVCVEWEAKAQPVWTLGCRLVTVRTGLVLARKDGVLPPMALPFKLFGGGPVGTGRQYLSWIHVDDWVALTAWAIGNSDVVGIVNASAPEPVTNEIFSRALGRALGRPCWLRVPPFAMRLVLGKEMADCLILQGQRVLPARAIALGFPFQFTDVDEALGALLSSSN